LFFLPLAFDFSLKCDVGNKKLSEKNLKEEFHLNIGYITSRFEWNCKRKLNYLAPVEDAIVLASVLASVVTVAIVDRDDVGLQHQLLKRGAPSGRLPVVGAAVD
jgi:hypothetical protein